jgi:hypothetical protein
MINKSVRQVSAVVNAKQKVVHKEMILLLRLSKA